MNFKRKELELIGRGAFTKAYKGPDGMVYLDSVCQIKECMAFGWFPECSLFPKMERVWDDEGCVWYKMEYYEPVRSLKNSLEPQEWGKYKALRDVFLSAIQPSNHYDLYSYWFKHFQKIELEELRDYMLEALDAAANCGSDIAFEVSPRNVATKNGKLVLLDVFYKVDTLRALQPNRFR